MTKVQIIVDDEKSLKAYTCTEVNMDIPTSDFAEAYNYGWECVPKTLRFTARGIYPDDSPTLISLPDELLLRIRDYNIDSERQRAINQTFKLKDKMQSLEDQVRGWELRRDLAMEDWEKYHKKLVEMIDKHPEVAAEIALEDGKLDIACHFAEKASKKRRKKK